MTIKGYSDLHPDEEREYLAEDLDVVTICPYCGSETGSRQGCCGESSQHFEKAYVVDWQPIKRWDSVLLKWVDSPGSKQSPVFLVDAHGDYITE